MYKYLQKIKGYIFLGTLGFTIADVLVIKDSHEILLLVFMILWVWLFKEYKWTKNSTTGLIGILFLVIIFAASFSNRYMAEKSAIWITIFLAIHAYLLSKEI